MSVTDRARWRAPLILAALLVLGACDRLGTTTVAPPAAPAPMYGEFGLDPADIDPKVKPGESFFLYATGGWMARNTIPPDRSYYGIDTEMGERARNDLREIAEAAATAAPGTPDRKLGDFYASYMDEAQIEAQGIAPLKTRLDAIAAISSRADLARAFARTNAGFGSSPIGVYIDVDIMNPSGYAAYLSQAGLTLPDRDYYLKNEEPYIHNRAALRDYAEKVLTLAGIDGAAAKARAIVALETRIAKAHWAVEETRDVDATYNAMTLDQLQRFAPGLDWRAFMEAGGLDRAPVIVIAEKSAFPKLTAIVRDTPLDVWKAYLSFHAIDQAAEYLPAAFDAAYFDFHLRELEGRTEQRERWKRAIELVDTWIGEALGAAYVARRFPPEARQQSRDLVENLKRALHQMVDEAAWLDDATKTAAHVKLDAMAVKIGYPDIWRDYSRLDIQRNDALGNVERAIAFEYRRKLDQLTQPIDRTEWQMTPQTINAYNDFGRNEIVFPAGILQPPYFDMAADPAVNYGATGATIGHEISHGFDDQGRKFDATGLLADWWTEKDAAAYTVEAQKLLAQFNSYEPLPGLHINGELTQGENIADLAGLAIAYRAYKISLNGREAPVLGGLTGDQRFFIAYAMSWTSMMRDEAMRSQVVSNEHSPPRWRVDGIVRNFDPWYDAFDIKPDDPLYVKPEDRVRMW